MGGSHKTSSPCPIDITVFFGALVAWGRNRLYSLSAVRGLMAGQPFDPYGVVMIWGGEVAAGEDSSKEHSVCYHSCNPAKKRFRFSGASSTFSGSSRCSLAPPYTSLRMASMINPFGGAAYHRP